MNTASVTPRPISKKVALPITIISLMCFVASIVVLIKVKNISESGKNGLVAAIIIFLLIGAFFGWWLHD